MEETLKDIIAKNKLHKDRMQNDKEYAKDYMDNIERERKEYWMELKPFINEDAVPHLPIPLTEFYINKLIELGAIPKDRLVDGVWYYGNYRNATLGRWDEKNQEFDHLRYKFGYRWDRCNHFEDDDRYAVFTPLREANNEEIEEINRAIETLGYPNDKIIRLKVNEIIKSNEQKENKGEV